MISMKWSDVEFPVTNSITKSGKYEFSFIYTQGGQGIDIESVKLFKDKKETSKDVHSAFSGTLMKSVTFKLNVPDHTAGADYKIVAKIKGSMGTDSSGNVMVK